MVESSQVKLSKTGHYFGAGPTMLPAGVHKAFAEDHINLGSCRLKLYELSHRHPIAINRIESILNHLRHLLAIPDQYDVVLSAGGARHQYELIASNFTTQGFEVGVSGCWSRSWHNTLKSIQPNNVVSQRIDSEDAQDLWDGSNPQNRIRCFVSNETVDGVMLPHAQRQSGMIIADVTSDLGFRTVPIEHYSMVFAATGKAFGVSGMCIIIINKDFLKQASNDLPSLQSYPSMVAHRSMYATPPLICIDMLGHMLDWVSALGGIRVIEARQKSRSEKLYEILEEHPEFTIKAPPKFRSMHNICFDIPENQAVFFKEADNLGLFGLRGHRLVGGARISLTHGVSNQAFNDLCQFLIQYRGCK